MPEFFVRALPASAGLALDDLATVLERESSRRAMDAVTHLRSAARAAYPEQDLPRAREHFDAALTVLRDMWPDEGF